MANTSAAPDWFDRACSRFFAVAGQAALIAGLWFGLMRFPSPPTPGLDSSWQMALGYAASHGLQFGQDLVFTYGPLGYLMNATNLGEHLSQHLAWQLIINLVFAVSIYLLGRTLTGWRKVVYYVFFFAYGTGYLDTAYMIVILILSLALVRERILSRLWLLGVIAAFLAALALAKFTNLGLVVVDLACVLGYYAWRRHWAGLAVVAGAALGVFLAGWVTLGQHLENLPAYAVSSFEISRGYNEAMGIDESRAMFFTGLAALFAVGAYLLLTLWRRTDQPRALAIALIAAAAAYLNWKHGFVRADEHVRAHFYFSLLFACSFPVLLQDDGPLRRWKGGLLTACAAFCLVGIWQVSRPWITNPLVFFNLRVMENLYAVAGAKDLGLVSREQFASVRKGQQLPATKALVGDKTVDLVGDEQAYVFFNQFNYRPRPVFQSYSAYTPRLAELNEAFLASSQAPEFVLMTTNGIDNRLPSMDDALARRYVLHHYTYQAEENGFLVWKRNPARPELDRRRVLSEKDIAFSEVVNVPPASDDEPIWCEFDVRPSLLGRLRSLFYKPPQLRLSVADGDNFKTAYTLTSGMGRTGWLLHPYLTSNYAIARYMQGGSAPRLQQFSVELSPANRKYFERRIGLRLIRLEAFPRAAAADLTAPDARFRVFSQSPTSIKALFPPEILLENNHEVLLSHPPSELEFHISAQIHRLTGKFGLVANAYTNGHTTDGAEFSVEWIDAAGKTSRLFYRHLRPLELPQDRGEQSFDLAAPAGGGRMILRIMPGPVGNISFDWAYWTAVKLAE